MSIRFDYKAADDLLTAKMVELLDEMKKGKQRRHHVMVKTRDFAGWCALQRAREYVRAEMRRLTAGEVSS